MGLINKNVLKRTLSKQAGPILEKKIIPQLEKQFEQAKKAALQDFESHAVTQELEEGPTASNKSGTLRGRGNLHSFIGFEKGENPIAKLRELLASKITIQNRVARKGEMVFYIKVGIPSDEDIENVTQVPWAPGRSWARGIEEGLSGLGNYLIKDSDASRSGTAIQIEATVGDSSFSTTSYLTKIIGDLVAALEQNIKIQ
jgi:hypothetical protein